MVAAAVLAVLLVGDHARRGVRATPTPPPAKPKPKPPPAPPAARPLEVTTLGPFGATVAWRTPAPTSAQLSFGVSGLGTTRWLPATRPGTDHALTLSGLAPSTAYHVDIVSTDAASGPQTASIDLTTPGLPAAPAASTSGAWIRLDGAPWFPFMEYGACSTLYASHLDTGIDLFAANPCGGLEAQTAALAGRGLSAGIAGESGAAGPGAGVVGTFYPDEADTQGYTGALLPALPPGLRFLTLSNHFFSGADQLPDGGAAYPELVAKSDVVGFDLYPLQGWCAPDRVRDVYLAQRELVALAAGRPTFQWIEAAGMNCPTDPSVAVTPDTVRAESWLAILGGAHGLGFFPAAWTGEVARAVTELKPRIAALLPALVYGSRAPASVAGGAGAVIATAWALDDALYVVGVNATGVARDASIVVPGLGARSASVLGEQRAVAGRADSLADGFAPYAVHVYIVPPRAP